MKCIDTNDYLYHYTSLEALASILQNRTIRFKSLDQMDDCEEKETGDLKNFGQFCYVSSWTGESEEIISLWEDYTKAESGVRVALRKNPFVKYKYIKSELEKLIHAHIKDLPDNEILESIVPLERMKSDHFYVQPLNGNILYQVQYTDDKNKLFPSVIYLDSQFAGIDFGPMGKYKNPSWSDQSEWRYIFYAISLPEDLTFENSHDQFRDILNQILKGSSKQPFSYYDLKISDDAFSDMKIMMSSTISDNSRKELYSLIKKYNPTAIIEASELDEIIK